MTEEIKGAAVPEDSVIRILEQQSRHGIDQETMLIYMSSVNLMSILNLISRRHGGNPNLSLPAPAAAPALPLLAPGVAPGSGPSLDNLMGMLMKMLGGQGGGNSPGGQGINPALMNLLGTLAQNVDPVSLMSMLGGLMGSGAKPAPGPASGNVLQTASSSEKSPANPGVKECGVNAKTTGEEKAAIREVPKIMKWDHLDDRKKA